MLRYYVKRSQGEEFKPVNQPFGENFFMHGVAIELDELATLARDHQLDANVLDDMFDAAELPRAEFSKDTEYIFLRSPHRSQKGTVVTTPLLAILQNGNFFLLSHYDNLPALEKIIEEPPLGRHRSSVLFLKTVAALLDSYDELITKTAHTIRDTGQRLRTHEVTNQDFIHFVTVADNLNEYHMNLGGMLTVVRRLKENTHNLFSSQDIEVLDDVILHIEQQLVSIDTHEKRIENIRNAYTTIANNTLNSRMGMLTVLTVIIALPNVFYGMYGMNIALPFAEAPWAYAAIMTFTVVLVTLVIIVAKRFKLF